MPAEESGPPSDQAQATGTATAASGEQQTGQETSNAAGAPQGQDDGLDLSQVPEEHQKLVRDTIAKALSHIPREHRAPKAFEQLVGWAKYAQDLTSRYGRDIAAQIERLRASGDGGDGRGAAEPKDEFEDFDLGSLSPKEQRAVLEKMADARAQRLIESHVGPINDMLARQHDERGMQDLLTKYGSDMVGQYQDQMREYLETDDESIQGLSHEEVFRIVSYDDMMKAAAQHGYEAGLKGAAEGRAAGESATAPSAARTLSGRTTKSEEDSIRDGIRTAGRVGI